MTKRKGSKKPTGGKVSNHSSARKRAMIKPAQDAKALVCKATALAGREKQLKREQEAFEEKQRVTTAALEKWQRELDERDRLLKEKGSAAEKTHKPAEVARMKAAAEIVERLAPKRGELLTTAESRAILILYFGLVKDGISPNQAAIKVASTLRIGRKKMTVVRQYWEDHEAFIEVNGQGRDKVNRTDDGRLCITPDQVKSMRAFITSEHESGRKVFRRTVAEWMVKHCGHEKQMSDRSVGRLLYRLNGTTGSLVAPSAFDKDEISRDDDFYDKVMDTIFREGS